MKYHEFKFKTRFLRETCCSQIGPPAFFIEIISWENRGIPLLLFLKAIFFLQKNLQAGDNSKISSRMVFQNVRYSISL